MDIDPSTLPQDGMKRGGGWSVITGWGRATISRKDKRLWQTLNRKSACLSCAWGTGGQNGGFAMSSGSRCCVVSKAWKRSGPNCCPQFLELCLSVAVWWTCGSWIHPLVTG